jgi:hypothetical protein
MQRANEMATPRAMQLERQKAMVWMVQQMATWKEKPWERQMVRRTAPNLGQLLGQVLVCRYLEQVLE